MSPRVRNRIGMGVVSGVLCVFMAGGPDGVSAGSSVTAVRSCPGGNVPPRSDALDKAQQAVLCLLNAERAARRLRALGLDPRLQIAAQRHSQNMAARDFFDHVTPDGSDVAARVRAAGFPASGARLAENLAWGSGPFGRPLIVVRNWMRSPPHRATILDPEMRQVGVGLALGAPEPDVSGAVTYTAVFAGAGRRTPRAQRRESRRSR